MKKESAFETFQTPKLPAKIELTLFQTSRVRFENLWEGKPKDLSNILLKIVDLSLGEFSRNENSFEMLEIQSLITKTGFGWRNEVIVSQGLKILKYSKIGDRQCLQISTKTIGTMTSFKY